MRGPSRPTAGTALVQVLTNAPTVTTQPLTQYVPPGSGAIFSIVANGGTPLAYQWQREIAGVSTTFAGAAGVSGSTNATGSAAHFYYPSNVAVDSAGNIYVADASNQLIRKITPSGVVSTLAGRAGRTGTTNATGGNARFNSPLGVAVDGAGNVFVADANNHTVRRVTPNGVVTTLAGSAGVNGTADGIGTAALFDSPSNAPPARRPSSSR